MEEINITISARLKAIRKENKMTQREFADKFKISQSSYCGYENGSTVPTLFFLIQVAQEFNISMDYLTGLSESKKGLQADEDYQYFVDLINKESVDTLVVGLPYNMMGEEQEIAHKAREFGNKLAELSGCKLVFVDERMTSVVAEDILRQKYRDWRDRKKNLDKYSAMVILQDYLDTL